MNPTKVVYFLMLIPIYIIGVFFTMFVLAILVGIVMGILKPNNFTFADANCFIQAAAFFWPIFWGGVFEVVKPLFRKK